MTSRLAPCTNNGSNKSYTLPFAHRRNISRIALTPRGNLLLSVDDDGHTILTNLPRRLALHHFSFKGAVSALAFSPSGGYFAVGLGRFVEVWHTPLTPDTTTEGELQFAPFVKHRAYAGHHDTVQSVEWSSDSRFFLSAAKDFTAKIWSLNPEEGFVPTTLAGHRESVLGAWFSGDQELVILKQIESSDLCLSFSDIYHKSRWSSISLGVCSQGHREWKYL